MKKYAKIIDEKTKACEVCSGTNAKFYEFIGFTQMDVEQAYDGCWYKKGYAPKKTQSEKEKEVRSVRSEYFDKYVDFYQSKPLYWEELSETERKYRAEYREYLKDYTKQEEWWEQNPMNYEEWLVAHHPVESEE